MSTKPLNVLIIGAGTTGLLIAHALGRFNIPCTVFEADKCNTERSRDWSFGVYWAQTSLKAILPQSIFEQIEKCQVDNKAPSDKNILPVYNIATDKMIRALESPESLRLQRRKWLKLITQGINIKYGKRLLSIKTGNQVIATFEDGSEETGDLLFGTEGAHSLTREFLLGPEAQALKRSDIVGICSNTKIEEEAARKLVELHNRHVIGLHPNGYFTWCALYESVGENPKDWTFTMLNTWRSPDDTGLPNKGRELVQNMKERAKEYGPTFRKLFEAIPDDAPTWHERLSLWPTEEWDSRDGTVTLAGDAAHPMTYHRGQGLNNAIQDAADFLKQLEATQPSTPTELKRAVEQYQQKLWPRGRYEVLESLKNTLMLHEWTEVEKSPLFQKGLGRDLQNISKEYKV